MLAHKNKTKWIDFEGRKIKDYSGMRFNFVTAICPVKSIKRGVIWRFKCNCGNIIERRHTSYTQKNANKSCGCYRKHVSKHSIRKAIDMAIVKSFKDLTGKKFSRLRVIELWKRIPKKCKSGSYYANYWDCICDCGNRHIVNGDSLRGGKTKSCGCYKTDKLIARLTKKKTKPENKNCGNHS